MTRSVDELRRESELNRAELAATVGQLRTRISNTAEDIRQKVSPEHIKSEVSDLISQKTQSWADSVKQRALDNPLQTVAAGAVLALPLVRMARAFPLPLLMIGAGFALSSKTARDREAAGPAVGKPREIMGAAARGSQPLRSDVADALSTAKAQASAMAADAQETVRGMTEDLRTQVAQRSEQVAESVKAGLESASATTKRGVELARSTAERARSKIADAASAGPETARQVIGDNAVLIGSLGIAIGAVLAASLPKTRTESNVVGPIADRAKRTASSAVQSTLEAAKEGMDAAAKTAANADLGQHATRMTEVVADNVNQAVEDAVTAAFDSHRHSNT